jgi:hypothetical protein
MIEVNKEKLIMRVNLLNTSPNMLRIEAGLSRSVTVEGLQFCPVGDRLLYRLKKSPKFRPHYSLYMVDLPPNREVVVRFDTTLQYSDETVFEFIPQETDAADSKPLPAVEQLRPGEYGIIAEPYLVFCDPSIDDRCSFVEAGSLASNGIVWMHLGQ